MSSVLRGGRLAAARPDVVRFISSLDDDQRIVQSTLLANEAHVLALEKCGAILPPKAAKILNALRYLENRKLTAHKAEDIHVTIEELVTRRTGPGVGGLMHLGKSRNDQVVTAVRMTLRTEMIELSKALLRLEFVLIRLAGKHLNSVFPGYTHLQPAQPISFAHYLMANCFALIRDSERLTDVFARVNRCPMGTAALAGTSFRIDRSFLAGLLGFDGIVEDSLDAVGGRDFALEFLSVAAIAASDISRIASDLVFYTSAEVGLLGIPDEFTSTSSIMPQKKNADPIELIRAKCARIAGNFSAAVTLVHGLPSGYNLDFQEITPILWQSADELKSCLRILIALTPRIKLRTGIAMREYLEFTAATELANILVREEKMPFREAHRKIGSLVKSTVEQGRSLRDLGREDWCKSIGHEANRRTLKLINRAMDLSRHIQVYRTAGSPNPRETKRLITLALRSCRKLEAKDALAHKKLERASQQLRRLVAAG